MTGRTQWFPKDAGWWRRARIVELGLTHGPAGPAIVDWLTCEARMQGPVRDHDGSVKAGYASVAHGAFVEPAVARAVIAMACEIGLLDDFEDHDDRWFTCRVSGWRDDIERPLAAARKQRQRVAECPEMSPAVTSTEQDKDKGTALSSKLDDPVKPTDVEIVWRAWQKSTGKNRAKLDAKRRRLIKAALKAYPIDELVAAVGGWKHSPHHRGENDRATVYNDIELVLRDAKHIEMFRDFAAAAGGGSLADSVRRHNERIAQRAAEQERRMAARAAS